MNNKKSSFILLVAAFGAFLATFNETFLNIAFTPIMKEYNISVTTVQWLTTAYMLGAAIMIPISSFAYRKYKTKPLFLITVVILLLGSIICALSKSFTVLLIGRIIQSLGTGMLIPIGMNMTLSVAPKEKLGSYMGIMGAMTTLGPSFSIISCGTLLNFFNWHSLFIFFSLLAFILFVLGLIFLGKTDKNEKPKLDVLSVMLISFSLVGILYGISTLFTGTILIALAFILIGLLLLIVFSKRQLKSKEPLINLNTLKIKQFKAGLILNMSVLVIIFATNIIMPLFLQKAVGKKALSASLVLFPAIMCSCILSPIVGKIYDKKGIKTILPLGFLLIFVFLIIQVLIKDNSSLILKSILFIPIIGGSAFIIGPVQSFALSFLKREENPHGVTVISTGFQIAGCIGSWVFTGIYGLVIGNNIKKGLSEYNSLSEGFGVTFLILALLALISLIISLKIRKEETKEKVTCMSLVSIMKKDVYTIKDDASLLEVLEFITNKKVSGVPVLDKRDNLVGFISDGDIMRFLSKKHPLFINAYSLVLEDTFDEKLNDLMKLKVKDVISKKLVTVDINTSIEEVCKILNDKKLKKVPVLDNNKLVGIINRSNITKYAVNLYLTNKSE